MNIRTERWRFCIRQIQARRSDTGIYAFLATFQPDDLVLNTKKSGLTINQGNAGVFCRKHSHMMKIQQNAGVFAKKLYDR